jgi:hypothetical protein
LGGTRGHSVPCRMEDRAPPGPWRAPTSNVMFRSKQFSGPYGVLHARCPSIITTCKAPIEAGSHYRIRSKVNCPTLHLQLVPSYSFRSRVSDGWRAYDPFSAAPWFLPPRTGSTALGPRSASDFFPSPVRKAGLGPPIRHCPGSYRENHCYGDVRCGGIRQPSSRRRHETPRRSGLPSNKLAC